MVDYDNVLVVYYDRVLVLCEHEQFLHWLLFFLPFFLEVGIGSYCFWASGFFVFPSVGRACLGFLFLSKKLLFVTKRI